MNQEVERAIAQVKQYKLKALELGASDIFLSSGSKPALRIHGRTIFLEDEPVLSSIFLEKYLVGKMGEEQRQAFGKKLELDFAIDSEVGAHDLSKLSEQEFIQYRKAFYPTEYEKKFDALSENFKSFISVQTRNTRHGPYEGISTGDYYNRLTITKKRNS
mgnify:CR=1 FL=1